MRVDLHLHSLYSDGALTPAELAARAKERGLDAAVLTDHDTDYGSNEFLAAAKAVGLATVRGFEMTTFTGEGVHILGYDCPPVSESPRLSDAFARIADERRIRNHRMTELLAEYGVVITEREMTASGTRTPSRAHMGRILIDRGIVPDLGAAYAQYLGAKGCAYVPFRPIPTIEAVEAVKASGGLAVLAHPGRLRMDDEKLDKLIAELTEAGLAGIETYYPTHTTHEVKKFLSLCNKYGLFPTNGSDFHREADGGIHGKDAKFMLTSLDIEARKALGL